MVVRENSSRMSGIMSALPNFQELSIEVRGCTGDLFGCNGFYEFSRLHKGKPLFLHVNGKGAFHWVPNRDGGVWALNGKNISPESGYHFSQSPSGANPAVPPSGQWQVQRFECNGNSQYPDVLVTSKSNMAIPEMQGFVIEVSGCTGLLAACNGAYEFERMLRGKPVFVNPNGKGVFHWCPSRDGGIWALNGRDTSPAAGYNFSQSPDPANPLMPPAGLWELQRFESNDNSAYPFVTITTKSNKTIPKMDDVALEVSGCTGELGDCNGYYEFNRMHRGKPLFVNSNGKGVFHWCPSRDGGIWTLNGKGSKPESGYNFSQSPDAADPNVPPCGQWRNQRFETDLGSRYPLVAIISRTKHAIDEVGGAVIEVSGCTGDTADCNGLYEIERMHNGKPLFVNINGAKGVLHWFPARDGGFWALNGKSTKPEAGYHFSQSPRDNPALPPVGQWRVERWETNDGKYPHISIMYKASAATKVARQARPRLHSTSQPMSPRSLQRSCRLLDTPDSPRRKLRQPEMVFA